MNKQPYFVNPLLSFVLRTVDVLIADQFGMLGDGVSNDSTLLATMLTDFSDSVIKFDSSKTYRLKEITVGNRNTLNFQNAIVTPFDDTDLFYVNEGSQVRDVYIDISSMTWTSDALTLTPTERIRGAQHKHWNQNVTIVMEDVNASSTTGNGVHFDASTFAIQEFTSDNLNVYWGNKAVYHTAGATEWSNGNTISNLTVHDPVFAIDEGDPATQVVTGNAYPGIMVEANPSNGATIQLNTRSRVAGIVFDRAPLVFKGDNNRVTGAVLLVNDVLVDEGTNNIIEGTDAVYYANKRSILQFNDYRNNLSALRGRGEYWDDFMTGVLGNESSVVSVGSGTVAFVPQQYGGVNKKYTGMRCVLTTGALLNDSQDLRWNDSSLRAGHDPIYQFTGLLSETADTLYEFGFRRDANNYVLYIADLAAGTITPKTAIGGVVTTGTPISVTFNRLFWIQIVLTNTSAVFKVGSFADSSNNAGDGAFNLSNEETITTNIPNDDWLQPRTYVETLTTATKQLSVLDVHVTWCYGFLIP